MKIHKNNFRKNLLASLCFSSALVVTSVAAQAPMSGPKEPLQLDKHKVSKGESWYVLQNTNIDELRLGSNATIASPGRAITMLVDGKEVPISKGKYQNVELRLSDRHNESPVGKTNRGVDNFRSALYVDHSGIVNSLSISDAIQGGSYGTAKADGITVESSSANFNGVMITGDIDYTLTNSVFDFQGNSDGSDISDFSGYGAAVAAYDEARLTLEKVDIHTTGVARLAAFAFGGADILMKDSSFRADGGELYENYPNSADFTSMVAPPWVLGITGSARATNMMGNKTTFTLVRTKAEAESWGVVSTDLGAAMLLTVVDSDLTLTGEKTPFNQNYGSGYGTYILGSEHFYYGVNINAGTYGGIIRDGQAYYGSSTFEKPLSIYPRDQIPTGKTVVNFLGQEEPVFDVVLAEKPVFTGIKGEGRESHIVSDAFGWMSHGDGKITIADGTVVDTGASSFLLKDGNVEVNLESGAQLNPANGVLLQVMDNDDSLVGLQMDSGVMIHFNTEFNEKAGYPGIDYALESVTKEKRANYAFNAKDVELKGDIYNSTGYYGGQAGDILSVTLGENAKLEGVISSTSTVHVDENGEQNTHFSADEYYYIGQMDNKVYSNGVNDIALSLKDNAVWTVTGKSLISELSLGEGASIVAVNGGALTFSVNGKEQSLKAGTYKGNITIDIVK